MNSALSSMVFPLLSTLKSFPGAQTGKTVPANAGKLDLTPGSGRPLEKGMATPLLYSCLGI